MNINNLFIEKIKKFIYNDPKLAKIFTHHSPRRGRIRLVEAIM